MANSSRSSGPSSCPVLGQLGVRRPTMLGRPEPWGGGGFLSKPEVHRGGRPRWDDDDEPEDATVVAVLPRVDRSGILGRFSPAVSIGGGCTGPKTNLSSPSLVPCSDLTSAASLPGSAELDALCRSSSRLVLNGARSALPRLMLCR